MLEVALDPIQISRSIRWFSIQKNLLLSNSSVTGPSLTE